MQQAVEAAIAAASSSAMLPGALGYKLILVAQGTNCCWRSLMTADRGELRGVTAGIIPASSVSAFSCICCYMKPAAGLSAVHSNLAVMLVPMQVLSEDLQVCA